MAGSGVPARVRSGYSIKPRPCTAHMRGVHYRGGDRSKMAALNLSKLVKENLPALGSHVYEAHMAKTRAELKSRLESEELDTNGSFNMDLGERDLEMMMTLALIGTEARRNDLVEWLKKSGNTARKTITVSLGKVDLGYELRREDEDNLYICSEVTLVLQRTRKAFDIVSFYPSAGIADEGMADKEVESTAKGFKPWLKDKYFKLTR